MILKQDVEKGFDRVSKNYDNKVSTYHNSRREQIIEKTLSKIKEKHIKKFLEVGIGTGDFFYKLLNEFKKGTGTDISKGMLNQTKEKTKKIKNKKFKLLQADIEKLPFKKDSFDFVFTSEVLQYLNNHEKAIKELTRVTKKNGRLLIINWSSCASFLQKMRRVLNYGNLEVKNTNYPKLRRIIKLLRLNKFKIVEVKAVTFFPICPKILKKSITKIDQKIEKTNLKKFSMIFAIEAVKK